MGKLCLLLLLAAGQAQSATAQRIVSFLPSDTEILYALGAGPLAGVSRFCDYPPETAAVPKIGDLLRPNIEKITQLRPDLVLVGKWNSSDAGKRLARLGLNVVSVPEAAGIEDLLGNITLIGEAVGRPRQAAQLRQALKRELESLKLASPAARPRVYVEVDAPHWTAGGLSYLSDLIEQAGGRNIFAGERKAYFNVSWESVVSKNPDAIIVLSRSGSDFSNRRMAGEIKAVKTGRIFIPPDKDIYLRPSPRITRAVRELQRFLHEK